MVFKDKVVLCADTTVIIDPNAEQLAQIALETADTAEKFDIKMAIHPDDPPCLFLAYQE